MMKKLILIFTTVFYLASASGAGVHLHYCSGQLVNWTFVKDKTDDCGFCGMEKKQPLENDCCKDVDYKADLDKAYKLNNQSYKFEQVVFIIPQFKIFETSLFVPLRALLLSHITSTAPPLGEHSPIFIKNCTFRI
ncbi:hypothetical protein ACFU8T_10095 [Sphingobacterium spiritivorum]|uniref:Uncharacterized protein n=1 Tax=Sphingobacterium spiritivorum ATCC 33861 TaxID=525373 RepID=D7VNZ3_SPHSI|nr:hypothetical protein [Sphingobacterium spiritivorum]EFK57640.1 hypothetical protein HMPREF0766_12713 [Sphingobacterium spiritivorum ATCC 33861]QQT36317.1 hypothetical protein I6J01_02480 [Sphingobacterium spiritivorum]WQD33057.1 hypothetical protein U0038_16175 [Sphingobacterium spiritivorum]SUJ18613.1 Uncharacterised protein [Sphingobacterium spiritivorum]